MKLCLAYLYLNGNTWTEGVLCMSIILSYLGVTSMT